MTRIDSGCMKDKVYEKHGVMIDLIIVFMPSQQGILKASSEFEHAYF